MKVPLLENTCILLLPVSATYTLSVELIEKACGPRNCPSAVPTDPHSVTNE
jgi:hypothetical protein